MINNRICNIIYYINTGYCMYHMKINPKIKKKKQNPTSFSISTRFTGNKFLYFQQEVVTVSILNQFHCNSVFPLLPKNVQSPYLYHPRSGSNKYTRILNIYIYMFSFCFCFNVRINRTSPYVSSTMT